MIEAENRAVQAVAAYAGRMLCELSGREDELLRRAVTRLLEVLEQGGTCIELSELGDAADVEKRLSELPVVGRVGEEKPLIIDGQRLYLQRYHAYESRLAAQLLRLAATSVEPPAGSSGDERRLLSHALGIVTGGPGTGKTTFAARLLGLVAQGASQPVSVALVAPTGKAAARLAESVRRSVGVQKNLLIAHGTIHRLLGPLPGSVFFRHNASRPLPYAFVVLDEASMADLPLLSKLVDAIDPASTRLIMLGDPGQLPSINCGSALADIVDAADKAGGMGNTIARCFLRLTKNHRSGERPELAALVDAVRIGDVDRALELLSGGGLSLERPPTADGMPEFIARELLPFMREVSAAADPRAALDAVGRHRLICMLRQGPCGADAANELALELARSQGFARRGERVFHGMPVIVSKNDTAQNLFNGDSGVVVREGRRLVAYFEGDAGPRAVPVQSLPPYEPAYALTVHRSQGSEYGAVTLLLPPTDHPLLTRELFYTGASRARVGVKVMATPDLVRLALGRKERRASGLGERLAG